MEQAAVDSWTLYFHGLSKLEMALSLLSAGQAAAIVGLFIVGYRLAKVAVDALNRVAEALEVLLDRVKR